MEVSIPKTKTMHVHPKRLVSLTSQQEITALQFKNICPDCSRDFLTKKSGLTKRSRKGSLADKAVQLEKRKAMEAGLEHVAIEGQVIDNLYSFEYLGSRDQCDGDETADVLYRMNIAQSVFSSYFHLWSDLRLPLSMKLRLYQRAVCSTFTHVCEGWDLSDHVSKSINGFNSICLHIITKKNYRETATIPEIDLLMHIRKRRLRFLGHILWMDASRLLRQTLVAYVHGGYTVPPGSLLEDCPRIPFEDLASLARDRCGWRTFIDSL